MSVAHSFTDPQADPACLTEAIRLLGQGYWPIPITPVNSSKEGAGKAPIGKAWGVERPTEVSLRRIWKQNPNAGVGLLLGEQGRIVDIEVDDPLEGENSLVAIMGGEVVDTMGWSSYRGNHRIYVWDERLNEFPKAKYDKLPGYPGIELRFGGSQLQSVCPPSPMTTTEEGGRIVARGPRRWFDCSEPATLPPAFFANLRQALAAKAKATRRTPKAAPTPDISQLDRYVQAAVMAEVDAVRNAADGTRNDTLNAAAFSLGQLVGAGAISRSTVESMLSDAAAAANLNDGEIPATIRSGLDAGAEKPRDLSGVGKNSRVKNTRKGSVSFVSANPGQEEPSEGESEADEPSFVSFVSSPPEPKQIKSTLRPVPCLNDCMLPEALKGWVSDVADRMAAPLDFVGVGAMVALGSVLGRRIAIRPKALDDWSEVMNLWGGIVARPGQLKTPSLQEALKPLHKLAAEAQERFQADSREYEISLTVEKARKEAAKAQLAARSKKGDASDEELRDLANRATDKTDKTSPAEQRYVVNDPTVEKMAELLVENPRGLLLFRDELVGFLKGLDRHGHEQDAGFYLEAWNGKNSWSSDRIGRGKIHVPAHCISILGGIQPGPLATYMRSAIAGDGERDSGFVQRFQVLVYPDPVEFRVVDRKPNAQARDLAYHTFTRLDRFEPSSIGAEVDHYDRNPIPYLRFAEDAQGFFYEWLNDLTAKIHCPENNPAFESHLSKYRSLLPKLATIFHLCDAVSGDAFGPVSLSATQMAAAWCDYLEQHARRIYDMVLGRDLGPAQALAEKIRNGELPSVFNARDVYRKGWSGLTSQDLAERAIGILEDHQWVHGEELPSGPKGGRSTWQYHVNPRVLVTP